VRIDLASRTIVGSIAVGSHPSGVAVGEGSVWVTNSGDGTVSRIDPVTNTITATITVGQRPQGIAVGEGTVWVANNLNNTVSRIDPATNETVATISVATLPFAVVLGEGSVWAISDTGGNCAIPAISRIDPATNRVVFEFGLDAPCEVPVAGAVGGGTFWLASDQGSLARVDLGTNTQVRTVQLHKSLVAVTVGEGAVWVASSGTPGTVFRIDPQSYAVDATIPAGGSDQGQPAGILTDSGGVWVTDSFSGSIVRIAVAGNDVQLPIEVGKGITGIAAGLGAIWVTVNGP
jgi:YVTN family beta-propeller protein